MLYKQYRDQKIIECMFVIVLYVFACFCLFRGQINNKIMYIRAAEPDMENIHGLLLVIQEYMQYS